jgi:ubiquinone biosynthesis UbiH/UbiF/VisC/COQ6 family hydroxylase
VGGGPVGACLARAARGLRVALVSHERRLPRGARDGPFDARVYALSPGNVAFLREISAWDALPAERLNPVHAMRIFGDDGASSIEFDAYRAGVPELAWIVEDGALQDALWRGLEVELFSPAECQDLNYQNEMVSLTLRDGRTLQGKLIVGADGANSFVRRLAGIEVKEKNYGQSAVVANFVCEKPHADTAWQWFQGGPVLALLPLPQARVSMVWSLASKEAERVAGLEPEALCREVEAASHGVLGALRLASPQKSYPLRRLSARRLVAPGIALVGDAGHVIHPLAGQGLNLGLQDARVLAAVLAGREPARDPGDLRLLRRYERARAEPILAMDTLIDGLHGLFNASHPSIVRLRNAGLNLTDRIPVLKNILVRQAMQ